MKQKDKDLLLKDLCARLPYGVKIQVNDKVEMLEGIGILDNVAEYGSFLSCDIEEVKPYLFSLSSMTEEQKNDCPISETNLNIINSNIGYGIIEIPWRLSYLFTDWCNKNHFDYRGLIPMGLANDATGLNIY